MKNSLTDLNNHLFVALERLNDENISVDEMNKEIERSKIISEIADKIIRNAQTQIKAYEVASDNGEIMACPINIIEEKKLECN